MEKLKHTLIVYALANFLFIWGVVTKDFYLLIPLNLGLLWGIIKNENKI